MIPKIEEAIVKADTALGASAYGSGILKFLESLKEHSKEATAFLDVSSKVTKNIQEEITHVSLDPVAKLALLSANTNLFHNQIGTGNDKKTILTPWSNLGRISRFLMTDIKEMREKDKMNIDDIEIYALQLKTPLKFLEKYVPVEEDKKGKDTEWIEFINENILDKHRIKLMRYFAAIDDKVNNGSIEIRPQEYKHLLWGDVAKECLKNKYYVEKDIETKIDRKEMDTPVIYNKNDQSGNLEEKTVSEILGKTIHKEGHCFIRIFDDEGKRKKDNKDDYHSLLLDEVFNKLIDYLAIRKRNKNNGKMEWIFCVRSLYDEDFDAAKIEFLHPIVNDWIAIKDKLESIFDPEGKDGAGIRKQLPLENSM